MIAVKNIPVSKRIFDLSLAFLCLVILSPLFLILALLVWYSQGRPVLFTQLRPGLKGKPFKLYKFRTMTDAQDAEGKLLPDDERMTRLGKFLRASSLDELPELVNVLRGEMSLVGPRPLLMQYLAFYDKEQARRHDVLPGITGWAQVNGRNAISWEDKFQLDVWYVDHWSLGLDLKILWQTLYKVIIREGVNQPGFSTAEEWHGSQHVKNGKKSE